MRRSSRNPTRWPTAAARILVLLTVIPAAAVAQEEREGRVEGRAVDPRTGAGIPGLTLELREAAGPTRTTQSDDAGRFTFDGLCRPLRRPAARDG